MDSNGNGEVPVQWEQFEAMFENFPEILYVTDPDTYEVIFVNNKFKELLGHDPKGKLCYKEFHGFDKPCEFCTNEIIRNNGGKPHTWEYHNKLLDRTFQITDQLIEWPDGRTVRLELATDITEAKSKMKAPEDGARKHCGAADNTEDALLTSETKFRNMFENMATGSCIDELVYENGKAVDYRMLDINPAFEKIIGVKKADVVGKLASEIYGGKEIPFFDTYVKVAETGEPVSFEDFFPPIKKYLSITASSPAKGRFSTVFSDITERKNAEDALAKSRELLRDTAEMAKIGGWEFFVETLNQTWTEETFRILEVDFDKGAPEVPEGVNFIAPEYRSMADEAIQRAMEHGEPYDQEWEVITAKGNRKWVRAVAKINTENGKIKSVSGSFHDITNIKKAEESLRLKNRMLQSINDYSDAISFTPSDQMFKTIVTKLKKITGAGEVLINDYDEENQELVLRQTSLSEEGNSGVRKILGRKLEGIRSPVSKDGYKEIMSSTIGRRNTIHEASFGEISKPVGKTIEKMFGFGWFLGLCLKHNERLVGTIMIAGKKGSVQPGDQELLAYASTTANVLARRSAEISLAQNEERFRALIEKGSDVIMIFSKDGKISYASPSFQKMFNTTPEDFMDGDIQEYIASHAHPDDLDDGIDAFISLMEKPGAETRYEFRFKHIDGTWHYLIALAINHNETPGIDGIIVNIRDISEQKKATRALAASEVRYRRLFETAKDGILILDAITGQIVDVNPFLTDLLGYTREEFFGKKIWQIGLFRDIAANEANFLELQEKGYVRYEDMPLETRDGRKINVEFVSNVYLIDKTKVVQCNIRDITQRKHHELEIKNLNSFLLSIRNLNQEIVQAEDFDILLKDSCRILTEIRGYIDVSMAFRDDDTGEIMSHAHHGEHGKDPWRYSDEHGGEVPPCIREVMENNSSVILDKEHGSCIDCCFCDHEESHQSILVPMRNKSGELMGIISACLERSRAIHPQEVPLFEEVAGDLAYAYEKLRGERALAESEMKYRYLVEKSLQGMVIALDNPVRLAYASQPMEAISGYSAEELLEFTQDDLVGLIHPDDRKKFFGNFKQRVEGKDVEPQAQYRLVHKDGSTRWVEIFSSLIEYNGRPATQTLFLDITDRKIMEQELKESEKGLREAQRMARMGSWNWNLITGELQLSDEMFNIIGLEMNRDALDVSTHERYYTPESWVRFQNTIEDAIRTGEPYGLELELVRKDGPNRRTVTRGEAIKDDTGKVIGLRGTLQDITERKEMEDELRKAQENFYRAFMSSPAALAITGLEDGKFIIINEAYTKIMGHRPDDIIGRTVRDFDIYVNPGERDEIMRIMREKENIRDQELAVKNKFGEIRNLYLNMEPIIYDGEKAIISTFIDITERKEKEEAIRKQLDELKRWQNVMLDREDRLQDLKREVNELCRRAGEKPRYASQEDRE